jgi:tyrosine-protein phosphatase YwqE
LIFFSKKKTKLNELIPDNFVDIHSHLIPGIDDGSKSMENTSEMMESLKSLGFEQFITTPHIIQNVWNNNQETIQKGEIAVMESLSSKNNEIPFKAAAEYMLDTSFSELLQKEKLLTLKENYVLVEMSYLNPPMQLVDLIYETQLAGYIPILAHPERYLFYHNNMSEYEKIKKAGCLFQMNLLSAVGYYGEGVAKTADNLLKKGMIDFVGSDVHHQKHVEAFSGKIIIKEMTPLKEAIHNNQLFRFLF